MNRAACQQSFSKPCLVNLISKDTHLALSLYSTVAAVISTVSTHKSLTHLKTVPDISSTSTKTTLTTPAILPARTSTIQVTPVCVDAPLCNEPHTKSSACNDNYIAAKYCPKLCGVCGKIYALVMCNHCPHQPTGKTGTLLFCLQFPAINFHTVDTTSW